MGQQCVRRVRVEWMTRAGELAAWRWIDDVGEDGRPEWGEAVLEGPEWSGPESAWRKQMRAAAARYFDPLHAHAAADAARKHVPPAPNEKAWGASVRVVVVRSRIPA